MANQTFSENLLRAIVAEFHVLNLQTASREMFGRSYARWARTEDGNVH